MMMMVMVHEGKHPFAVAAAAFQLSFGHYCSMAAPRQLLPTTATTVQLVAQ